MASILNLRFFLLAGRSIVLVAALILSCVGPSAPWVTIEFRSERQDFLLTGVRYEGRTIKYKDTEICKEAAKKFEVTLAFGILSCLVIAAAIVTVAVQFFLTAASSPLAEKILKFASLGLSAFAFTTTLITFAVGVTVYTKPLCDTIPRPFKEFDEASLGEGANLFIAAWVLMVVDVTIAVLRLFFGGAGGAASVSSVGAAAATEANADDEIKELQ